MSETTKRPLHRFSSEFQCLVVGWNYPLRFKGYDWSYHLGKLDHKSPNQIGRHYVYWVRDHHIAWPILIPKWGVNVIVVIVVHLLYPIEPQGPCMVYSLTFTLENTPFTSFVCTRGLQAGFAASACGHAIRCDDAPVQRSASFAWCNCRRFGAWSNTSAGWTNPLETCGRQIGSWNPRVGRGENKKLVGGWTNPFEKYSSKWECSPNRDENKKYLKPPPRKMIEFPPNLVRIAFVSWPPYKNPDPWSRRIDGLMVLDWIEKKSRILRGKIALPKLHELLYLKRRRSLKIDLGLWSLNSDLSQNGSI